MFPTQAKKRQAVVGLSSKATAQYHLLTLTSKLLSDQFLRRNSDTNEPFIEIPLPKPFLAWFILCVCYHLPNWAC